MLTLCRPNQGVARADAIVGFVIIYARRFVWLLVPDSGTPSRHAVGV